MGTLGKLPYPVIDTRIREFPRVQFTSHVTLDMMEPTKTYQSDGSRSLLQVNDGILCLRCGAGKTVTTLHTVAQQTTPALILVDEKSLAEQWIESIVKFLHIPRGEIGFIGDGVFNWQRPIAVATIQTLANMGREGRFPDELVRHFGVVVGDEVHVMGAPHFNRAVPPFHGRRWGLSATPVREDAFDSLLRYTFGDIVFTYLEPDLKPTVYFRRMDTRLNPSLRDDHLLTHDRTGEFHFGKTYGWFASHRPKRTEKIVKDINDALSVGREVLVLTHSREMCDVLGEHFPNGGVVHGGVKGAERRRRIKECNPVIAIMKVGKQALDKPSLDTLFVIEPFSKKGMLQQTMGRILRKPQTQFGKREPLVFIYEDSNILPLRKLCNKLRTTLRTWPPEMGGAITYHLR